MIIVLYYSTGSIYPALLASLKHCYPALSPEQADLQAAGWLKEKIGDRQPPLLTVFGESSGGELVCLASARVPPPLLGRILSSFGALLGNSPGAPTLLPAGPLPPMPRRQRGRSDFWREIEARVEQARLQLELIGQR